MGSKGWPKMQCDKPRANEWGKANQVHTMEEKMFKAKRKKKDDSTNKQLNVRSRP
jgi:hypothetical protein